MNSTVAEAVAPMAEVSVYDNARDFIVAKAADKQRRKAFAVSSKILGKPAWVLAPTEACVRKLIVDMVGSQIIKMDQLDIQSLAESIQTEVDKVADQSVQS